MSGDAATPPGRPAGERLEAAVARVADSAPLAASPASTRLLAFLLEATRDGRRISQRDVAEAVFGDADRTQRARGAVRELRRRLAEAQGDDSHERLELTEAPWQLRLVEGAPGARASRPAAWRRPRVWQVVAGALVAAFGLGVIAHAVASVPERGADRRAIACVRHEGYEAVARNAWGQELWRRPERGGGGPLIANAFRRKALIDLTGDGRPEAVVVPPQVNVWPTAPMVARDGDGREVFRLAAWKLLDAPDDRDILADVSLEALPAERTGLDEPFVLAMLVTREPVATHVALVDATGRRVGGMRLEGRFLHAEPLDVTDDGVAEVVLAGNVGGHVDPHVVLVIADVVALSHGASSGETARLSLPPPMPIEWAGADSFSITALQALHGWVEAELSVGHDVGAWLYVDAELEPSVFIGDTYARQLDRLAKSGRYDGPLNRREHERLVEASIERVDRRPGSERAAATTESR